jgi:hypothetical protein
MESGSRRNDQKSDKTINLKIKYIGNKDIDYNQWDNCIRNAPNGNVYALSWYLDYICEGWDALVTEDYSCVMPLPSVRKFGTEMLLQPLFAQQHGVYGLRLVSQEVLAAFLDAIPAKYRYININLNKFNKPTGNGFAVRQHTNFELGLISPYSMISQRYNENTRRNIKKAEQNKLTFTTDTCTPNQLIDLIGKNVQPGNVKMNENHFSTIRKIIANAQQKKYGEITAVYDEHNELCAAAFFLFSHQKAMYMFAASTETGKELRAMFLLVDAFIKKYSEKNLILDFEGSNIEGLARFYGGFGAVPCLYPNIVRNRLPWILKLFKK